MVIKRTESHKNEEQFHFSTKAETLASLKGVLVSGKLCDQAVIPVQDWLNDQQKGDFAVPALEPFSPLQQQQGALPR